MLTKQILHQAMLNEWASRFADQQASGLTVAEWCRQNEISRDSYFYWKRKLKDELITQALPEIVPLVLPDVSATECKPVVPVPSNDSRTSCTTWPTCTINSPAKIHIGNVIIELDASASENFITSVIKAVCHA